MSTAAALDVAFETLLEVGLPAPRFDVRGELARHLAVSVTAADLPARALERVREHFRGTGADVFVLPRALVAGLVEGLVDVDQVIAAWVEDGTLEVGRADELVFDPARIDDVDRPTGGRPANHIARVSEVDRRQLVSAATNLERVLLRDELDAEGRAHVARLVRNLYSTFPGLRELARAGVGGR